MSMYSNSVNDEHAVVLSCRDKDDDDDNSNNNEHTMTTAAAHVLARQWRTLWRRTHSTMALCRALAGLRVAHNPYRRPHDSARVQRGLLNSQVVEFADVIAHDSLYICGCHIAHNNKRNNDKGDKDTTAELEAALFARLWRDVLVCYYAQVDAAADEAARTRAAAAGAMTTTTTAIVATAAPAARDDARRQLCRGTTRRSRTAAVVLAKEATPAATTAATTTVQPSRRLHTHATSSPPPRLLPPLQLRSRPLRGNSRGRGRSTTSHSATTAATLLCLPYMRGAQPLPRQQQQQPPRSNTTHVRMRNSDEDDSVATALQLHTIARGVRNGQQRLLRVTRRRQQPPQ